MRLMIGTTALVAVMALATPASAQTLRVTASTTNLRAQPTATSTIVETLSQGAELEVIERQDAWYRVRVRSSGAEGFVHSLVVEAVAASSPAPATRQAPSEPTPPSPPPPPLDPTHAPVAPTPVSALTTDRTYFVRAYGGLFSGYLTTGFGFGGGIAGRPFGNDQMEIQGDFLYARLGDYGGIGYSASLSMYQGSGNFLYNFPLSSQTFTPFVGGGLVFGNTRMSFNDDFFGISDSVSVFSGVHAQAIAGIEWPISDRTALRVELRSTFPGLVVLGGVSF